MRFSSLSGTRSLNGSILNRCSRGGVITILPISRASRIWVETVSAVSCERPRLLRAPIDGMGPDACSHPGMSSEPARKVVHLSQPANSVLLSARNCAMSCRGDVVAECGRCAGSSGSLLRSPTRSRSYMSMLTVLGPADAARVFVNFLTVGAHLCVRCCNKVPYVTRPTRHHGAAQILPPGRHRLCLPPLCATCAKQGQASREAARTQWCASCVSVRGHFQDRRVRLRSVMSAS